MAREGARAELGKANRDLNRVVQALLDGTPARTVKDRMAQLEVRKEVLEAELAQGEDVKIAPHPSMARFYRERVAELRATLTHEHCQTDAAEIMRTLTDRIELRPEEHGKGLSITLHGELAGILSLCREGRRGTDAPRRLGDLEAQTKVVAGGGFEPPTFRL